MENVERYLKNNGKILPRKSNTPLYAGYHPEMDISTEINPPEASYYMSIIGIICWIVEIGQIDLTCEVSMVSSTMAMPQIGHIKQFYTMFCYLKSTHNADLVLDPTFPNIYITIFLDKNGVIHPMMV